jgi:hypothetical protein
VVVIPDEQALGGDASGAGRFGPEIERARIDLPAVPDAYRYRLIASIVLAEISRQLGRRPHRPPHPPRFASTVTTMDTDADLVTAAELHAY